MPKPSVAVDVAALAPLLVLAGTAAAHDHRVELHAEASSSSADADPRWGLHVPSDVADTTATAICAREVVPSLRLFFKISFSLRPSQAPGLSGLARAISISLTGSLGLLSLGVISLSRSRLVRPSGPSHHLGRPGSTE